MGSVKLDAQHTSPGLPRLATKYFHLSVVTVLLGKLAISKVIAPKGLAS